MKLETALDGARKKLSKAGLRTRLVGFSAWKRSLPVSKHEVSGSWKIGWADKRANYDVREADRKGDLTVYEMMIRYREPGSHDQHGALRTIPVRLKGEAAVPTAQPRLNFQLIDHLASIGVTVTFEGDAVRIDQADEIAVITGESRIAAGPVGKISAADYVDHRTHPAILEHPTLRFFVEGRNGCSLAEADAAATGLPRPLSPGPANDGVDEVGTGTVPLKAVLQSGHDLDPDQKAAIALILDHPLVLIAGPPGTGKSELIAALARELGRRNASLLVTSSERSAVDVARRRILAAPASSAVLIGMPDEVAAIRPLRVGEPDFDILVIDEASMMPMETALWLMTRAKRYVLIGDGRQLRPDGEEQTALERADELGVPRVTLRYHYRSRNQTLISLSNLLAYDMSLRTVPTPDIHPTSGLKAVFFPNGRTTSNRFGIVNHHEAAAVVERARHHLRSGDPRSLGIIAANTAQKNLIAEMMAGDVRAPGTDGAEPFFVRTTHEIQGEERDVVLISAVYDGRDPDQRFGAFDRRGWVRRLNVVLSRSRHEMTIFTSFAGSGRPIRGISPGRRAYVTLHELLKVQCEPETRLKTSSAIDAIARRLSIRIDRLGVVFGLSYAGDERYRAGLVLTSEKRTEDHWRTIIRQLEVKGWLVLAIPEASLIEAPEEIKVQIAELMANAATRKS